MRCEPDAAEMVLANLLELAPNGVEEERGPGFVEFAIYGPPGEVPDLGEIRAAAGGALVDVTTTSVPDDWADRWADFHKPIEVGGRIGVRPSWWEAKEGLIDVLVDPGQAFGTGGHPTTKLSLALLLTIEESDGASGPARRLGHRLGRARDRRGEARLGAGHGVRPRARRARGGRGQREGERRRIAIERVDVREGAPPVAPNGHRQPHRKPPARLRRASGDAGLGGAERPRLLGDARGGGRRAWPRRSPRAGSQSRSGGSRASGPGSCCAPKADDEQRRAHRRPADRDVRLGRRRASRSCTSAWSRCPRRTSSTSATTRASRTAHAPRSSCAPTSSRSRGSCSAAGRSCS